MNMLIKKRQLVMATLVLALGAAVFVNWYFTKPDTKIADSGITVESVTKGTVNLGDAQYVAAEGSQDFFEQSKLDRAKARDEAFEKLNAVINSTSANKEAIDVAAAAYAQMSKDIKLEADLESAISAKIGGKCIVVINEDRVEIAVENGKLNDTSALQIKELAVNNLKINTENIVIIEAK